MYIFHIHHVSSQCCADKACVCAAMVTCLLQRSALLFCYFKGTYPPMLQLAWSRVVSIMPKPQPGRPGCTTFIWSRTLHVDLSSVVEPAQGTKAPAGIAPGILNSHKQPHQQQNTDTINTQYSVDPDHYRILKKIHLCSPHHC